MKYCVIKNTTTVIDGSENSEEIMLKIAKSAGFASEQIEILTEEEYTFRVNTKSLDEIKQIKINELNQKCNETIVNGFYSDADGINKLYDFALENQLNLNAYKGNIVISGILGNPIETISYYAKGEECHEYTSDQFLKLANDGETWKTSNIVKYKDKLKPMVEACVTVNEVNAITWESIFV